MKLAYFPNQTAMKSESVWRSFLDGWHRCGHTSVENTLDADAALIWSVLWNGRMRNNKTVFDHYRRQGKPVFILEVGSLIRGKTWKLAVNNITADGIYPIQQPRIKRNLDIVIEAEKTRRRPEILIATQHEMSLQWQGMPAGHLWLNQLVDEIRQYTRRPIVIRPHPRGTTRNPQIAGVKIEFPRRIPDTYDRYDIDFNYHCVINHNSGVGIQAALYGTPVITGANSLASELSGKIQDIEKIYLPDRSEWYEKILHTEWTVEELASGLPQNRLLTTLNI